MQFYPDNPSLGLSQNKKRAMKKSNLTNAERNAAVHHLLLFTAEDGTIPRGALAEVAVRFGVARHTIRRIWHRASVEMSGERQLCQDVSSRKKGNSGRKQKHESIANLIKAVPKARRTTFATLATAINVPVSTLHGYYKRGSFVKYSSTVKPLLTDANKAVRVAWSMGFVRGGQCSHFDDMMDYVHVDEKWFFTTKVKRSYYLAPGEEPPHRTCKSKTHIMKVMFLSAVARPRWDNATGMWFDGKIGTWHFTEMVPAQRTSRNRPKGTLEMKPVVVDRAAYRSMLIDNVIPAIKAKWPVDERHRTIKIQQDNARPHVLVSDPAVAEACAAGGWLVEIVAQPPNSPDMNVLDLGFFRSIQTLQERNHSKSVADVVAATNQAWDEVDSESLNATFLTLQCCMQETIRASGNNDFKIPHMKKKSLLRQGKLPERVVADSAVVEYGMSLLQGMDLTRVRCQLDKEVADDLEMADVCSVLEMVDLEHELDRPEDIFGSLGVDSSNLE